MVRKCRGLAEVAVIKVAQVGVRTRAQALAMVAADSGSVKRRKLNSREEMEASPSYIRLRSSRREVITPENSVSTEAEGRSATEDRFSSRSSDHDCVSASCCSSNGSSDKVNERIKFADLEDESVEVETSTFYSGKERREMSPSSELRAEVDDVNSTAKQEVDDQNSTAKPELDDKNSSAKSAEVNSVNRSTEEKKPAQSDLDKFFETLEKDLQEKFTKKYNFDFVNEKPLEGRYEWVKLEP